ncbi:MAG TPA: hypothetical protein VF682_26075 [Pseudomonas sp.]|jgi:hypothetical protein
MNTINLAVAEKLAAISRKPGLSHSTMLILTRRVIQQGLRHRDLIRAERRIFRREAGKLKAYLPFTQAQIDVLMEKARAHRQAEMADIKKGLVGTGYHLVHDTDGTYAAIGFDGICDLLNINRVHREAAKLKEELSLAGLIYIARLENSASPEPEAWGEGGPLFEACFAAMCDWIRTAPKENLPDLFGPGSPFAAVKLVQVKAEVLH